MSDTQTPRCTPANAWYADAGLDTLRRTTTAPDDVVAQVPRWGLAGALAAAADAAQVVGRPGMSAMLAAVSLPVLAQAATDPGRVDERFAFYAALDPATAFAVPPVPPADTVVEGPAGLHTFDPDDAEVVDVGFASGYRTLRPAARAAYGAFARNDTVRLRHWRHRSGGRPTLVCIHGFQVGSLLLNGDYFDLRSAWADGFDCVLIQLPHHGSRARGIEGFGFLALDLAHVIESIAHSVWDVRATLGWLAARGIATLGLTGVSLGGLVAALVAAVDDRVAFCVPVATPVSIVDTFAELPGGRMLLDILGERIGVGLDDLRDVTAVITPAAHRVRLAPQRARVVAASGDRIVRPWQQAALARHWGCDLVWAPGTHQIHFDQRARRHLVAEAAAGSVR